jgi:hypothetical protein
VQTLRRHDEKASRRPGGVAIVAEQALRAVLVHHPWALRGEDEEPAGRGQARQRSLRGLASDGIAEAVDDGHPGRRQRRHDERARRYERD